MKYKVLTTFDSKGKRYLTDSILEDLEVEKATQLINLELIEEIAEKIKTKSTKSDNPASKEAGSDKTNEGVPSIKEAGSDKTNENNKEIK